MKSARPLLLVIFLFSCYPTKRIDLINLSLGMTKQETVASIGKPENLIGAKQYPNGQIEVFQYSRYDAWDYALRERYWLYYYNDTLRQWGRPGDWEREADKVYDVRFR